MVHISLDTAINIFKCKYNDNIFQTSLILIVLQAHLSLLDVPATTLGKALGKMESTGRTKRFWEHERASRFFPSLLCSPRQSPIINLQGTKKNILQSPWIPNWGYWSLMVTEDTDTLRKVNKRTLSTYQQEVLEGEFEVWSVAHRLKAEHAWMKGKEKMLRRNQWLIRRLACLEDWAIMELVLPELMAQLSSLR